VGAVGYSDIQIQPKDESREFIDSWVPGMDVADYVLSAHIIAFKP
jgi:arsenite methyltransferase